MQNKEIIRLFLEDSSEIIKRNLDSTKTNASGATKRSLRVDMLSDSRGQLSGYKYIYVVETGRKPGKMPPVSNILAWAKVRGLDNPESRAWAIAKNISKFGTKLFQKGGKKDIITPIFEESRLDKLEKDLGTNIVNQTLNAIDGKS